MISNTNTDDVSKITNRYTGLIAQDLQNVLPEAVHKDKDGKLSIAYGNMAGLFVESLKDLEKENLALKTQVIDLEKRLIRIEGYLSSL